MILTIPDAPASTAATATVKKPTIGRMVYYTPKGLNVFTGKGPYAAIVTGVNADGLTVKLHAFHDSAAGMHYIAGVPHRSIANDGLCWDWPPIV